MTLRVAILASTLVLATGALAAPPKPVRIENVPGFLMDSATAAQVWNDSASAQVLRLYPPRKFRFVSEVGGGFNDARLCVVTARAMLMPVVYLPVQGQKVVYAPVRSATAFDAAPNLDRAQCQQLARAKLKEAIQSMTSSLTNR